MVVWRLHLITGASPSHVRAAYWGLSKCHSFLTLILRCRSQSRCFPRSQIDPEGFPDEQEPAGFRLDHVGICGGMQHDPITWGLGADVAAVRVVEYRETDAPFLAAARDDQIFTMGDGARVVQLQPVGQVLAVGVERRGAAVFSVRGRGGREPLAVGIMMRLDHIST